MWSLSRPLTYRSLDQLTSRGYVHAVGEEPGIAGGNRTILAATRSGRAQLRKWLATPVAHLRDLRSELLLKLVIAELCGIDVAGDARRSSTTHIEQSADALGGQIDGRRADVVDVVALRRRRASSSDRPPLSLSVDQRAA